MMRIGRSHLRAFVALVVAVTLVLASASTGLAFSHYGSVVLGDLPSEFYTFDGNSTHQVIGGHDLTGSVPYCSDTPITGDAQSACGDGSNFFTMSGSSGFTAAGSQTVEFWAKATDHGTTQTIFYAYNSSGCPRLEITIDSGQVQAGYSGCGPNMGGVSIPDNGWHMWDAVYSTGTYAVYLDGVLSSVHGTWSGLAAFAATDHAGVCGRYVADRRCQSGTEVSNLSVYPAMLSGTQIAAHFAAAAGAPPHTLYVNPSYTRVAPGHMNEWTFQSTDASGNAVSGAPYSLVSSSPAGGVSACSPGGGGLICTVSTTTGVYTLTWADTLGNQATSTLYVPSPAAAFVIAPATCTSTVTSACDYIGHAYDSAGTEITDTDPWGPGTVPSGVTCVGSRNGAQQFFNCYSATIGTYTIPFVDGQGLTASATLVVGAGSNQQSCSGTDLGCWIGNLIGAVQNLASSIVNGFTSFLFVSSSGRSYLDLSIVTNGLVPSVACRSGQLPDHPDGVDCVPFPFSVPFDVLSVFALLNQTPSPPTWAVSFDYPGSPFGHLTASSTIDVTQILTPQVMTWVRDGELVLFVVGLAMSTWKFTQMMGVD